MLRHVKCVASSDEKTRRRTKFSQSVVMVRDKTRRMRFTGSRLIRYIVADFYANLYYPEYN